MSLREKIIFYRKEKGLTQEAVAKALGVGRPTYTNYENGKREPGVERIKGIATALGVNFYQLIADDDPDDILLKYFELDINGKKRIDNQITFEHMIEYNKDFNTNNS